MKSPPEPQRDLFGVPVATVTARVAGVRPAAPVPAHQTLAGRLPAGVRLGGMSWTYPGWAGPVYEPGFAVKALSGHGLAAYAAHPLLRAVEIDRSYYDPLSADVFRSYAAQVPDDFRFLVKAHEDCTVQRFPPHARYGRRRDQPNPRFLDADYAAEAVVAPIVAGLGANLGAILFQFPPQDVGGPAAFAGRLSDFLRRLPHGATYAVELRNAELLSPAYGAALAEAGAVHCHNVWTSMPPLLRQARGLPPSTRRPLIMRWLLRAGDSYERAEARHQPFNRLVDEDPANRADVADLAMRAHRHGVATIATVDNKAEGCAPESIFVLARAIADAAAPDGAAGR